MKARFIVVLITIAICIIAGGIVGYRLASNNNDTQVVDATYILSELEQQGFLISQSYVYRGQVVIDRSSGNSFKDFFFGQEIIANADVKVSSGIDMSSVEKDDINVQKDRIVIKLPSVEIFSTEILGPVELRNTQGVLKRIFDNDDGYNEAVVFLKEKAKEAAAASALEEDAKNSAIHEITRIVQLLDKTRVVEVVIQ